MPETSESETSASETRATGQAAGTRAVWEAARAHAPDFYLAARLAPRPARGDLVKLAAYLGEVARIPLLVSEPLLGEIRLQWWREAIETPEPGTRTGNPVADALLEMMVRRALPRDGVLAVLESYDHLLARGALTEDGELAAYIDGTSTAAFRLAALVLGCPADGETEALVNSAGRAHGHCRLALDLPYHVARGRQPLPVSWFGGRDPRGLAASDAAAAIALATRALAAATASQLTTVRRLFGQAARETRAAVLPVALVEPYFRALHKPGRDGLREPAEISPLTRAGRLWLARWRGKV